MVFMKMAREQIFQIDSAGLRGQDCKLFKNRFRLDVNKM